MKLWREGSYLLKSVTWWHGGVAFYLDQHVCVAAAVEVVLVPDCDKLGEVDLEQELQD